MATSTNSVQVSSTEYVNVSSGNLNCYLTVDQMQKLRVHIGGIQPESDVEEYFVVQGGGDDDRRIVGGVKNLEAEDEVWVRTESGESTVVVVRGNVEFNF